jgi:hypothetical protein
MNQDRANLEFLVWYCLTQDEPIISISRGRELLGFKTMDEIRDFFKEYSKKTNMEQIEKE